MFGENYVIVEGIRRSGGEPERCVCEFHDLGRITRLEEMKKN
jgi:hypothetical protein